MRATILLAAVILAAPAAAQGQRSDPCATAPADVKQRIDGKKSASAQASAAPASFIGDGCDMLVVDVTVPAGYEVALEGAPDRGAIPASSCEQWRLVTRWFTKSGGKYEPIGGKTSTGTTSTTGACIMERHVQEADATAPTTFRIAVISHWGARFAAVRTYASVRPLSSATH
jgi:hypothetical protein